MFRSGHSLFSPEPSRCARPGLPLTSIPSTAGRFPLGATVLARLLFALLLFRIEAGKRSPAFSHSSALLKNACFNNSLLFNDLRTLLQNTGSVLPRQRIRSRSLRPLEANSSRIRTYQKRIRNPFRIRTSKTQHLKLFRMNTYKK
jgi:hypothetical protein